MFDHCVGGSLSRDSFGDCCRRHRHTGSPRWHQRMFTWPHAHQAVHVYAGLTRGQVIRCPGITDPCCGRKHNPKRSHAIASVGLLSVQCQPYVTFFTVSFLFIPAEDGLSCGSRVSKEHLTLSTGVFSNPPSSRQHFFLTWMRRDQSPKLPLGAGPAPPLWCDTTDVVEKPREGLSEDTLTFLYGKALVPKVGLKKNLFHGMNPDA